MNSSLSILSGLILTVLAVMANAYWQDAVRWDKVCLQAVKNKNRDVYNTAECYVKNAKCIFRFTALLGSVTTSSVILGVYNIDEWAKSLLIAVLIILTVLLILITIMPKYYVPIETSVELIKLEPTVEVKDTVADYEQ